MMSCRDLQSVKPCKTSISPCDAIQRLDIDDKLEPCLWLTEMQSRRICSPITPCLLTKLAVFAVLPAPNGGHVHNQHAWGKPACRLGLPQNASKTCRDDILILNTFLFSQEITIFAEKSATKDFARRNALRAREI